MAQNKVITAPSGNLGYSGSFGVLLWENDAPTTTFGAQTVDLDLTGFDWFVVEFRRSTTVDQKYYAFGTKGNLCGVFITGNLSRQFTPEEDNSGITFSAGYSGSTVANANAIPLKVFAIS